MGRCDSATCSIGVQIEVRKLIEQISEETAAQIKKMLEGGFLDYEEGLDTKWSEIVENVDWKNPERTKAVLLEELGSLQLVDRMLLYPATRLMSTELYGGGVRQHRDLRETSRCEMIEKVERQFEHFKHCTVVLTLNQWGS